MFMRRLRQLAGSVLDFMYPPVCPICRESMEAYAPLCAVCDKAIRNQIDFRQHDSRDFYHLTDPFFLDAALTFWEYSLEIETCIHLVKYRSRIKLGRYFVRALSDLLTNTRISADCIIPVPLHASRFRERGFNQSAVYAEAISRITGIEWHAGWLKRSRYTKTQTRLSAEERQDNVRDAFTVRRSDRIEGRSLLLVDDVITSGATINSCARACKAAGAQSVTGLGLARPRLLLHNKM